MLRILTQAAALLASTSPSPAVSTTVATSAGTALQAAAVEIRAEGATGARPGQVPAPADTDNDGDRRRFNLGRAGLEIAGAMAIGVGWYESQIELNKLDFDFDRTWRDQGRRLFSTDGYRFDDNNLVLNVGHAFMGAYYHQFARQNGGGMGEALLFDLVTSSVWELTVEHREVVSLNDTVVTSLGGVPIGEGLYQIGDYFARSRPTVRNRILMGLFSPAHAASMLWGDRVRPSSAGFDQRGLARDAHRHFQLSVGGAHALGAGVPEQAADASWVGDVRLDMELINQRSYGRAATRSATLGGGQFTRVTVDYLGGRNDLRDLALTARSSMWGFYRQQTTVTGADGAGLRGHALFLGSATAFDLSIEDRGSFKDFVSAVHLLGPAADLTLHRDRLALRLSTDVTPDFAMVRPFALDPSRAREQLAGSKSTLQKHSYYYAMGVATNARLEARYRQARAGAALEWNYYDSVEGLDRHQQAYTSPTGIHHPAIRDDSEAVDQRMKLRVYGESPLPLTDVRFGVSMDYRQRSGTLGDAARSEEDLRMSLLASYAL